MTGFHTPDPTDSHNYLQQPVGNMAEMRKRLDQLEAENRELQRRLNIYDYRTQNVITYLNSDNPTPAHRICARLEIQDARAGR